MALRGEVFRIKSTEVNLLLTLPDMGFIALSALVLGYATETARGVWGTGNCRFCTEKFE